MSEITHPIIPGLSTLSLPSLTTLFNLRSQHNPLEKYDSAFVIDFPSVVGVAFIGVDPWIQEPECCHDCKLSRWSDVSQGQTEKHFSKTPISKSR
jgi:hypothetical protein